MSLKATIKKDLTEAMKAKDEIATTTLRLLVSQIADREKTKRADILKDNPELVEIELFDKSKLSEDEALEVVMSEAKKRREAMTEFEKGGRDDLVKKESAELAILQTYLPEQMSEEDITALAKEAIAESGAASPQDMGKVMQALMPKVKGKADGKVVSAVVTQQLNQK